MTYHQIFVFDWNLHQPEVQKQVNSLDFLWEQISISVETTRSITSIELLINSVFCFKTKI